MIDFGLFESIITEELGRELEALSPDHNVRKRKVDSAELADRMALHVGRIVVRAIESQPEAHRSELGVDLVRSIVEKINEYSRKEEILGDRPMLPPEVLSGVFALRPDGSVDTQENPRISLLDTTLLTNAPGEPTIGAQILSEIDSADRIDIIMAFVRKSGIRRFEPALRRHCERGGLLRVLTTTYTGSTEQIALESLIDLGGDVRISYDVSSTRLHAKAWLFHRNSGYSTAYIGSSNLTYSAQVSGLEWNLRVAGVRNPDAIRKMVAMFDGYWSSGDFVDFDREEFEEIARIIRTGPDVYLSPVEIRLEPFQERLLELINVARLKGNHRNLLVSATGTGKTVMAAIDYQRLSSVLPRSRLLFVAHRKEILDQSIATFRHALRNAAFGEEWVAGRRPESFEHVFASIQSLNARGVEHLDPEHFDVVIIDEFHHAAAKSYQALLTHLAPKELLGLTATPERSDGLPILDWFDDGITAELRLWDAIDQQRLVPFEYFGISDGVDLRDIPWKRGRGYDIEGLENVYTSNDAWARLVVKALGDHVGNVGDIRALGFCVSVNHAKFMTEHFLRANIRAQFVTGDTPEAERTMTLNQLRQGELNVVFSVDLFNEGVDIPLVDTLLLLRPTDSPVLFTQQLGRGLRVGKGKSSCLVLDFVGQHRKEYRFDRRLGALLHGTRKQIEQQVVEGFPFLPAGCHMELDRVARDVVLRSLKESLPSRWNEKAVELRRFHQAGHELSLTGFLTESGLALTDIYTGSGDNQGWSNLLEKAELDVLPAGKHEVLLRRAIGRLTHIDDEDRIDWYLEMLQAGSIRVDHLDLKQKRMLKMLLAVLFDTAKRTYSLEEAASVLFGHPQVLVELCELLSILKRKIDHMHQALTSHSEIPLVLHSRYSGVEIIAAFGVGKEGEAKSRPWREGVLWVESELTDVFKFTFDKTGGSFSPTTRYRDYAISRDLIHWESQSETRVTSPTGKRYQHHVSEGSSIMLFARETPDDRAFWFLGPATYVSHQSERPMEITWRLDVPLAGDLFTVFAASVA